MFTALAFFDTVRIDRDMVEKTEKADLFSAGTLATAPGGHGTQFGIAIPTLTKPEEAAAFVAERVEEGSDYIKIVYEPGRGSYPSLDFATVKALVDAAHAHNKLAVVHVSNYAAARGAVDAGADGLMHAFGDKPVADALVQDMATKGVFIVPTLSVIAGLGNAGAGAELAADPALSHYLSEQQVQNLNAAFGLTPELAKAFSLDIATANVAKFHAGGVTVLAGSDSPNPGTTHGPSVHGELAHFIKAGMTPLEALRAATSKTATAFKLGDWRGRIVEDGRADFVLVDGDPTTRIKDTRKIITVWKNGFAVDRPRLGDKKESSFVSVKPDLPGGVISNFETDIASPLGGSWMATMDKIAGGTSEATIGWVEEGAGRTPGALHVAGNITTAFPFPWSGAGIFFNGNNSGGPYDLSDYGTLHFMARGEARTYSVMLFTRTTAQRPAMVPITMRPMWLRYDLPLDKFAGVSLDEVYGIAITAGKPEGPFKFEIDDVMLLPKQ
jgi:hypothetical protein